MHPLPGAVPTRSKARARTCPLSAARRNHCRDWRGVAFNTESSRVVDAKMELCAGHILFSSQCPPAHRLRFIDRDPAAKMIGIAEVELCGGVSLLGRQTIPAAGFSEVDRHPATQKIHVAQGKLRIYIARIGCNLPDPNCAIQIALVVECLSFPVAGRLAQGGHDETANQGCRQQAAQSG